MSDNPDEQEVSSDNLESSEVELTTPKSFNIEKTWKVVARE